MSNSDVKAIIEKSIPHIQAYDYALIKHGDYNTLFIERLKAHEQVGEAQATTAKKIQEHFEKFEQEFENHSYFANPQKYDSFRSQLDEVCTYADIEKFKSLVDQVDLRRLGYNPGLTYSLQSQQQKHNGNMYWTPILFAIFQGQNDKGISDLIRELPNQGIHLQYAL